jgi:hypothetical protein
LIDAAGGVAPVSHAERAAATASAVLRAGRDEPDVAPFVELAERVGLDTLASLWRDAEPASLAGALWALYLLRQWCHSHGEEVVRLWLAGAPKAAPDAVVAGVPDYCDAEAVARVSDAVLRGAYRGDFAVALERAAAMYRVVAAGRREMAGPDEHGALQRDLAARNERVAGDLRRAADSWRRGTLD